MHGSRRPPHRPERRPAHRRADPRRALRRDRRHGPRLPPAVWDRGSTRGSTSCTASGEPEGIAVDVGHRTRRRLRWPDATATLDDLGCALAGPVSRLARVRRPRRPLRRRHAVPPTIDMARHRFGEGQYRYFAPPLPELVAELRAAFWPHLLPIARDWAAATAAVPRRGPTASMTGSSSATPRGRPDRPR